MSVQIVAQLNLFEKILEVYKSEPCTIAEILAKIDTHKAVNTGWRVLLNDVPVTDFNTKTKDGDTVYVKLVPEGDNQDTGVGMKVAGGFLAILGGVLIATGIGSPLGVALIGSGIGLFAGGMALYNIDIPNMNREQPKQDPSLRGGRNQARPYGYVPILLGKRRIYADLAMTCYTWVDSTGDQYLYQLFCCGQKDIEIDKNTFKIGETLIKDYSASKNIDRVLAGTDDLISLEICHGTLPKTITKCVHEEQLNAVLKNKTEEGQDGSVIRTTPSNTTEINVDVFFYNGLGKYNDDGDIESTSVELGVWYKRADQDDSQYVRLGYFNGNTNVISGSELKTKRLVVSKSGLQPASWTVKVSRISADSDDNKIVDAVYVGSIRSIKDEKPVRGEIAKELTLIALKVKASEKLQNYVEELNFIAQSKMPVYTGSGTGANAWTIANTSNPASAVLYALQGEMAQQKLEDAEIDFLALEKLYQWCEQHEYECNAYVSDSMPISQLLSAIGSTCRAEVLRLNGKVTINQDVAKNTAVQLFTPRNSHGYSESLSLADLPDAIALKFDDEEVGFAENELKIYNTPDGNQTAEPQVVQDAQLWGVTNSVQARKLGVYKYAVSQNRPLIHKFSVDFEYMLCSKGDRIRYAGDIALAGITQGRIVKVIKNDSGDIIGLEADELFPMEEGQDYALRIRLSSGESVLEKVLTSESSKTVFFEQALADIEIQEGNLLAFGTVGNDSIDLVIIDIQCGNDLSADITAVDYAPEIFGVDNPNFVLPEYEPKITDVPSVMDSANLTINEWQTWSTYYDGLDKPDRPTGDGNTNGWHRIPTAKSMWISSKTAKDIYSGEWDSPIPTNQQLFDQLVSGENVDSMAPEIPSQLECIAQKDGIQLNWVVSAGGLKNDIQKYVIEKTANNSVEYYETSSSTWFYTFDRKTDGYPEREDLAKWRFRVNAVNVYGKESDWSGEVAVDVSQYKTWVTPPVRVSSLMADKDGLTAKWTTNPELTYGDIRYDWTLKYNGQSIKTKNSVIETTDTYTFDVDTDGYPEKPSVIAQLEDVGLPVGGRDISFYTVEVRAYTLQREDVFGEDTADVDYSYYGTWVPASVQSVRVESFETEIKVEVSAPSTPTHYGTPYTYLYQASKDGGQTWQDAVSFPGSTWVYFFDRQTDGYPEKQDLDKWRFRVKAVSSAGKESIAWGGTSSGVPLILDKYGTWKVQPPVVNTRVADRAVTLLFSQPARSDGLYPYGNVVYTIQVQRPDLDTDWFKPATDKDPFMDELNYKDGEGVITAERVYTQTMPLAGQLRNDIIDTLYRFKVTAKNEAGESEGVVVNATALCTSIRDIVKANETAKKAYISMLSAISANLGNISQGSLTGNDNNKWSLSTFVDDNGVQHYEGEFRAGGQKQYLHIVPILDALGQPTGEYDIFFKVGNFEISTTASTINGELIVMSAADSLDRTRITPVGTYYEHRETKTSQNWVSISQMRTDGLKAQSLYSDKTLVVTNMDVAERRKGRVDIGRPYLSGNSRVWHFDTDKLDQYGRDGLEILSAGETVLADQYNMAGSSIDFTPAILAVAPYSEVGRSLYGQFAAKLDMGKTNNFTVDFWVQYIWAENQILFDIGNSNDRIKLVVRNDEVYYNTPAEGEVPWNKEQQEVGAVSVYNEPAAASSYIQHDGATNPVPSVEHIKTFDSLGINFEKNTWLHVGLVMTAESIEVYLNHERVVFERYGQGLEDCDMVLNELMNTFVLDELLVDTTTSESFEDFARNTDARIPWGALDKDEKHFVLQAENLVTNIFDTEIFRGKVVGILAEHNLIKEN